MPASEVTERVVAVERGTARALPMIEGNAGADDRRRLAIRAASIPVAE